MLVPHIGEVQVDLLHSKGRTYFFNIGDSYQDFFVADMVQWLARLQGLTSLEVLLERASAQQLSAASLPELCELLQLVTYAAASSVQVSF